VRGEFLGLFVVNVLDSATGVGDAAKILKLNKYLKFFKKLKRISKSKSVDRAAAEAARTSLSKTISVQKQARHLAGTAKSGSGFLNNLDDAKAVLDAVHSGEATLLGTSKAGHQIYSFKGVTGTNVNVGAGVKGQPTNVFIIKGTTSPSVVPTNPNWKP